MMMLSNMIVVILVVNGADAVVTCSRFIFVFVQTNLTDHASSLVLVLMNGGASLSAAALMLPGYLAECRRD